MNRLTLGMPTLIELDSIEENAKLCRELGLDFVEINMNVPQFQTHNLKAENLLKLQEDYHIFFTFHLADDVNIGHFDPRVREAYLKSICDTIDLMKKINSNIVNIHMCKGIYFTLPNEKIYLFDKFASEYNKVISEFSRLIEEKTKGSTINLLIENTGIYNMEYSTNAVEILLDNPNIGMTWDIGHNYINNDVDKNFIKRNFSKLKHMHIHDATREKDHLIFNEGELDLAHYFDIAKSQQLTAVIETKTISALRKSVGLIEDII